MLESILIQGGVPLNGRVRISGAKNAALPIMAASILCTEPVLLHNVPQLVDIVSMEKLLSGLGMAVRREEGNRVYIDPRGLTGYEAPYDLVRKMRASFFVLGPLLAKMKRARVSLPGGCAIGQRPVDIHLKTLEQLGGRLDVAHGYVEASAPELVGNDITLSFPSVGATENLMMAATLAKGPTVMRNCAREPEVSDLAKFLVAMGASINSIDSDVLEVNGVERLKGGEYSVIPDRIEAGTYLVAGSITSGEVTVEGVSPELLVSVLHTLRETGAEIETGPDWIRLRGTREIRPVEITTLPYPGFPTDMQAQLMALCCVARGTSIIKETIYENRFMHASELVRLGADIAIEGNLAVVRGVPNLSASPVMASDLRASAALILAGLVAAGQTEVIRAYHLDRGYEKMEAKLRVLGARIERVKKT